MWGYLGVPDTLQSQNGGQHTPLAAPHSLPRTAHTLLAAVPLGDPRWLLVAGRPPRSRCSLGQGTHPFLYDLTSVHFAALNYWEEHVTLMRFLERTQLVTVEFSAGGDGISSYQVGD